MFLDVQMRLHQDHQHLRNLKDDDSELMHVHDPCEVLEVISGDIFQLCVSKKGEFQIFIIDQILQTKKLHLVVVRLKLVYNKT